MKLDFLRSLTYAVLSAALLYTLASCATGGTVEGLNLRRLGGADTIGGTAASLSLSFDDPGRRIERLAVVASAYVDARMEDEARVLLEYIRNADVGSIEAHVTASTLTRVGRAYARLDDREAARAVLDRARRAAAGISSESARTAVLRSIVDAAFVPAPPLSETLQATIQEGYIIQDFALRASFLLDLVERYNSENIPGSVNTLIQQALPAASSIADPWQRALAFARISRSQRDGQNESTPASTETIRRALDAAEQAGEITGAPQALAARRLAGVLASMDRRTDALRTIEDIPLPHLRALAYADLARSYFRGEVRTVGFLMLTRGGRSASLASTPALRAEGHLAIASAYAEIGEDSLSQFQLEQARSSAISAENSTIKVELLQEIARLYLHQEQDARVAAITAELPGGLVLARFRARLAEMLLDQDRRDDAAAQFREALTVLRSSPAADLSFAVRMCRVAARLDETELAIDLTSAISERSSRVDALAAIRSNTPANHTLTPASREILAQLLQ